MVGLCCLAGVYVAFRSHMQAFYLHSHPPPPPHLVQAILHHHLSLLQVSITTLCSFQFPSALSFHHTTFHLIPLLVDHEILYFIQTIQTSPPHFHHELLSFTTIRSSTVFESSEFTSQTSSMPLLKSFIILF